MSEALANQNSPQLPSATPVTATESHQGTVAAVPEVAIDTTKAQPAQDTVGKPQEATQLMNDAPKDEMPTMAVTAAPAEAPKTEGTVTPPAPTPGPHAPETE